MPIRSVDVRPALGGGVSVGRQGRRRPAHWPVPRLLRYDGPGLVRRLGEHPMVDAFVAGHHGPGEPGDDGNPLHDCSLSISDGGGPAGCKPPIAVPATKPDATDASL